MREHCHQNLDAGGAPTHVSLLVAVKCQGTLAGTENVKGLAGAEAESATESDIIGAEAHEMCDRTTAMRGHVMKKDVKNGHARKGHVTKDLVMTGPARIGHAMTGPARIDHAMTGLVRKGHGMMDHAMTGHVKTGLERIGCEMRNWSVVRKAQVVIDLALTVAGITTALENIIHMIIEHHPGKSFPFLPQPGIITDKCVFLFFLSYFLFTVAFLLSGGIWLLHTSFLLSTYFFRHSITAVNML